MVPELTAVFWWCGASAPGCRCEADAVLEYQE